MVALLVALLCVFAVITVRDVRYRLVYGEDLLFLVALRLLAAAGSLFPDASGLAPAQWGFQVLGAQMPASLLVAGNSDACLPLGCCVARRIGRIGFEAARRYRARQGRRPASGGMLFAHCPQQS